METKRYINSIHNENCKQVFIETKDPAALLRSFFNDNDDAHNAEDVQYEDVDDATTDGSLTEEIFLTTDEMYIKAIQEVIDKGLILHAYDYHVIMQVLLDQYKVRFNNGQSFVDYLSSIGIQHKLPTADDINKKLNLMRGSYPEWSWTNTDHNEEIRRINIAKYFVRQMNLMKSH